MVVINFAKSMMATLEELSRTQRDVMHTVRTFVDSLRDLKKEELVDSGIRSAIAAAVFEHVDGSEPVVADADLSVFTHGLQTLLARLSHTIKRIDEIEAASTSSPGRPHRGEERPVAPVGLLSLRDYSVLQAALEVFFCWSVAPHVERGLLLPIDRRRPTKTLDISRHVLQWGESLTSQSSGVIDLAATGKHLVTATRTMLQVLLLPQIQPILLPKYVVEAVALLVYCAVNREFDAETNAQSEQLLSSLLQVLPLRLSMTSLRAALGHCSSNRTQGSEAITAFKQRTGKLLSQLVMQDGGVATTVEMLLGAVDEGNTQARMQVATLICQCPSGVSPEAYAVALASQLRALFLSIDRQSKLMRETGVVLANEVAARFPLAFDSEFLSAVARPLLKYEYCGGGGGGDDGATEQQVTDCVTAVHSLVCGPPPTQPLLLALVPLVRPLVHLLGFALASKSFLATPLAEILTALITVLPHASLLLHVSVLPVVPPLRATLHPQESHWPPSLDFAAGGSGGVQLRYPQTVAGDEEQADPSAPLRRASVALVQVLGSKQLECSPVVGELFSSLLLAYMRVRSQQQLESNSIDHHTDPIVATYAPLAAALDPLGIEVSLGLLLAIIESLGASVLRSAVTVLQCLATVLAIFAQSSSTDHGEDEAEEEEEEEEEVITVCLGLVATILEAGATHRSDEEEQELRSLLPSLEQLSSSRRPQIADLATDARARILSRGTAASPSTASNTDQSFDATLRAAAEDLASSLVPLRARGVVTLTKLVRRSQRHRGDTDWTPRIQQLTLLFASQLSDSESYVFLAAAQGLAALADAHPRVAIPLLTTTLQDKTQPLETRIKLSEALLFAARRCGDTLPLYAKEFVYSLLAGIRPHSAHKQKPATAFSLIQEVDSTAATSSTNSDDATADADAANELLAEATLRASCLSNLAEVAGLLQYELAPFATDVLGVARGVLQLELDMKGASGAAVRRGAVFLLRHVLELLGFKLLEVAPEQLRPTYHTLKHVERADADEVVKFHARHALQALDSVMRNELFPSASRDDELLGGLKSLRIVKQ